MYALPEWQPKQKAKNYGYVTASMRFSLHWIARQQNHWWYLMPSVYVLLCVPSSFQLLHIKNWWSKDMWSLWNSPPHSPFYRSRWQKWRRMITMYTFIHSYIEIKTWILKRLLISRNKQDIREDEKNKMDNKWMEMKIMCIKKFIILWLKLLIFFHHPSSSTSQNDIFSLSASFPFLFVVPYFLTIEFRR